MEEEIIVLTCVCLLVAMVIATPHAHLTAGMCDLLHFTYSCDSAEFSIYVSMPKE